MNLTNWPAKELSWEVRFAPAIAVSRYENGGLAVALERISPPMQRCSGLSAALAVVRSMAYSFVQKLLNASANIRLRLQVR